MRGSAGRTAVRLLVLVVAGAALGALLGVLWEWLWEPPAGAAYEGKWYLAPSGLPQDVSATGWFTVLGLAGGLLLGTVSAMLTRDRELVTLAGVCIASMLAAWVMYHVGHLLGPPDPHELARSAGDLQPIPSDLRLAGADEHPWPFWFDSPAFAALPVGALIGLVGVFLGGSRHERRERRERHGAPGAGRPREDERAQRVG